MSHFSDCKRDKIFYQMNSTVQSQNKRNSQWQIENFEIISVLGKGRFGQVFAARQKKTNIIVAIKKMQKQQLIDNNFEHQIKRQVVIQTALKHRNILKLYGYFWDDTHIFLILEYASQGQIYKILQTKGNFSEQVVSIIIGQVINGVKYLHQKSIIHRDIKPENLMVSLKTVKIADFGWSIFTQKKRNTICGTLDYLSVEMIQGNSYNCSVDVWSIGILTYQLALGRPPFQTKNYQQTYHKIIHHQVQFPNHISPILRKFIQQCLLKDPSKRPSINQLLKEPFITQHWGSQLQL